MIESVDNNSTTHSQMNYMWISPIIDSVMVVCSGSAISFLIHIYYPIIVNVSSHITLD